MTHTSKPVVFREHWHTVLDRLDMSKEYRTEDKFDGLKAEWEAVYEKMYYSTLNLTTAIETSFIDVMAARIPGLESSHKEIRKVYESVNNRIKNFNDMIVFEWYKNLSDGNFMVGEECDFVKPYGWTDVNGFNKGFKPILEEV